MKLRPYQLEAIEAVEASPSHKQLVCLPTGTGKTVMFAEIAKRRQAIGSTLILVHRDELVRQAVAKLNDAGLHNVGIIQAEQNSLYEPITVASVQTLSRPKRARMFLEAQGPMATIIIDEAHHAPAPTYRQVVDWLLARTSEGCDIDGLLLGVTATPDRETQRTYMRRSKSGGMAVGTTLTTGMGAVFDSLTYYRPLTDMIAEGWLVDLVPGTVDTDIDLASVKQTAGDWQEGALGAAMVAANSQVDIVRAWELSASDRPTIAFLPTVETSRMVAAEFERHGYTAEHIDGTTPNELRQDTYRRLREGTTKVVTNCMVLTEGFDEPCVSCIIVARPTNSRSLFAQMVGRGSRLFPGKDDCLVLSVVDHSLDIDPVTLQTFLDDKGWQDGQKLSARKEEQAAAISEFIDAGLNSEAIAFTQAFKAKAKASLTWRKVGPTWRIFGGREHGWISLKPVPNGETEHWLPVTDNGLSIVNEPLPIDGAVSVTEQWLREHNVATVSDPNAKWRNDEPSEAQLSLARKMKLNITGMNKGQVSDLIGDKAAAEATPQQIKYARYLGHPSPDTATKRELQIWIGQHASKKK